jgi:hypothetical protein
MNEANPHKSEKGKGSISELWVLLSKWITKNVEKKGEGFVMKSPYSWDSDYEFDGNYASAEFPLQPGVFFYRNPLEVVVNIILDNASEIRIAKQKGKEVPKDNWVIASIELRYKPLDDLNIVAHPTNVYVEGTTAQYDELKAYIKKEGKPKGYPWRVNVIED